MEGGEMGNFVKVWTCVIICLCCCHFTGKIVPKGFLRLLTLVPVISIFLLLPLNLTSVNLGGPTSFFIAWLANFKLLLFAFGRGPLASEPPKISLGRFITVACLPIKIRRHPQIDGHPSHPKDPQSSKSNNRFPRWVLNYGTKGCLFAVLLKAYDFAESIHPKMLLCLYSLHIYITLEMTLVMMAVLAKALLRLELEPQFDEPYLSTSLQDFWSRHWNIMVTNIMRPTVYDPLLGASARLLGRKWAPIPAVLGTFAVSALMHELIFYYLGRLRPTWEITCFFLLHGACLTVEIALKKACAVGGGVGGGRCKWRVPRLVAVPMTVGFVVVTGFWLFFPQLLRFKADVRAFEEYAAIGAFVKDVGRVFAAKPPSNSTSTTN